MTFATRSPGIRDDLNLLESDNSYPACRAALTSVQPVRPLVERSPNTTEVQPPRWVADHGNCATPTPLGRSRIAPSPFLHQVWFGRKRAISLQPLRPGESPKDLSFLSEIGLCGRDCVSYIPCNQTDVFQCNPIIGGPRPLRLQHFCRHILQYYASFLRHFSMLHLTLLLWRRRSSCGRPSGTFCLSK